MDLMPVAIALLIGVMVLATTIIGIVWAMIFLLLYYAYIAATVYLILRSDREHPDLSASVEREAERQRWFNDQEMRAWCSSLEQDHQAESRRAKILRRFDTSRNPPDK